MAKVTTSDILNKLLFDNNYYSQPLVVPWAFCIHASIVDKWEKVMYKLLKNNAWEVYEHDLQIGNKNFDMRFIIVSKATRDQLDFLSNSIKNSQLSFPWEDNATLFTDVGSFGILKEFISEHNLEAYILKIEQKLAISVKDEIIKVVSFNQSVNKKLDIICKFGEWFGYKSKYYFMMAAFPWQTPHWNLEVNITNNFYSVLPIVLGHLGTLNYTNYLNIMDLLSLRWALSDVRDLPQINLVKYEIDFMIKGELAKIIKNNHLYLQQYMIDKNIKSSGYLICYLVYEFQNLFDTVYIDRVLDINLFIDQPIILRDTSLLVDESDIFSKLKMKHNVKHNIDGTGFKRMSLSFLLDLVEFVNVSKITLDTNQKWLNKMPYPNRSVSVIKAGPMFVDLIGDNTYNLIENFVTELKTIPHENREIGLVIKSNLDDFRLFNNLKVYLIVFENIKIDVKMLDNLQQCDLKPLISLHNCFFENTCRNWELLNNLSKLREVSIEEDEGTWQTMFEFVLNEMHKLKTNEFQFKSHTNIQTGNSTIWLKDIKFIIDEDNSKLQLRDKDDNLLDLYFKIFGIKPDEKSDYEFYQ